MSSALDADRNDIILDEDAASVSSDSSSDITSTSESTTVGSDDELIVEDEEEYESTDYCTDGSSTTSTSSPAITQQDSTRVCDCCYCEVFGHGVSPVAPTSRNYQQMRERLRKRLSKRREEKCQRLNCASSTAPTNTTTTTSDDTQKERVGGDDLLDRSGGQQSSTSGEQKNNQQKKLNSFMGDSAIDEILNFINGTTRNKAANATGSKKKDKSKNVSNKKSKNKTTSTSTSVNLKDTKNSDRCSQQNTDKEKQRKRDREKSNDKCSKSKQGKQNNIPQVNHNNKVISAALNVSSRESTRSSLSLSANRVNVVENKCRQERQATKVNPDHKSRQSATKSSCAHNSNMDISCQHNSEYASEIVKSMGSLGHCSSMATVPDDVFRPRNIDLDDVELDEFERELEAFKKFCLDSIPLVKKERVRIELKDSHWIEGFEEHAKISDHARRRSTDARIASSSREKGIKTM